MSTPSLSLPTPVLEAFLQFDYLTNRLKLQYLASLFNQPLNQDVLQELSKYYGKEIGLVGGMNEAFRWFAGKNDMETVDALPDGAPFSWRLESRQGKGNLLLEPNRAVQETCHALDKTCSDLIQSFKYARTTALRVALLAEFMAIKVTCHDLFIHGRGEESSNNLFHKNYVHIDPQAEADYIQKVLEAPLDAFRVKNVLSYAMAHGIDPVACLSGQYPLIHQFRSATLDLIRILLERAVELDPTTFFTWDDYGMCNFVEGPVFLRWSSIERCAHALARSWQAFDWQKPLTCTQACTDLAQQVFQVFYDHSAELASGAPAYFSDPKQISTHFPRIETAMQQLETAHSLAKDQLRQA